MSRDKSAHYILAIDQGTTSSRAIVFSDKGEVIALSQKEISLIYPQNGWVEQNPEEIWSSTRWAIEDVLSKTQGFPIAVAGITNQRETAILWDRKTGKPVYNAIVWQDRRTAEYCEKLKQKGVEKHIIAKTGLLLDPYFSATKIKWILDNVEGVAERARRGDILFGTPDCFILWHLTGGCVHATDVTNASRTLLYNIIGQEWDENLTEFFDIPKNILPTVFENLSDFGHLKIFDLPENIRIGGVVGDQQAALIGQGCLTAGMSKSTYGTGCFALMNIGQKFALSKNRLLTTIASKIKGQVNYAVEGSIFNAGTAIQFLRDNLGLFEKASQSEDMAVSVADTGGVYFVPAFTGLGAPYWNPEARGLISGISRSTSKAHITRAALEAQAYQTRDLMAAIQDDTGYSIDVLRIDGGLAANQFTAQFMADILQRRVEVPASAEATAWGAACLAGVQAGVFSSLEEAVSNWKAAHIYNPHMDSHQADRLYAGWKDAVQRVRCV